MLIQMLIAFLQNKMLAETHEDCHFECVYYTNTFVKYQESIYSYIVL